MPTVHGRRLPLSPARRVITEMLRACRDIPLVAVDRPVDLGPVVEARRASPARPAWTVIFAKAFALVSAEVPQLRRAYVSFPRPHLYEHPEPVAGVTLERDYAGEPTAFFIRLCRPHVRPLAELDAALRQAKAGPPEAVSSFRRLCRLGRLPGPLLRFGVWYGLHSSGRRRVRHGGTFGVTSVAAEGAGAVRVISPAAATLHYGLFDPAGRVELRLTFDHRVFDGGVAARALAATEAALRGPVLRELRDAAAARAA